VSRQPNIAWAHHTGIRLKLNGRERLVLNCLAELADGEGKAWPSILAISETMGVDRKSVRAAVAALAKHGLLRIEEGSGRRPTHYFIQNGTGNGEARSGGNSAPQPHVRSGGNSAPQEVVAGAIPADNAGAVVGRFSPTDGANPADKVEVCRAEFPQNPLKEESPKNPPKTLPRARPGGEHDPPGFDEFYARYPRKVARRDAARAYAAAIKRGASAGDIMLGLQRHEFSPETKYRPYPATWLNREQWKDAGAPSPEERRYERNAALLRRHGVGPQPATDQELPLMRIVSR